MTEKVNTDIRNYFADNEGKAVSDVLSVMGFNFGGRAQDAGIVIVGLKDFEERKGAQLSAEAVTKRAFAHFKDYKDAQITPFLPPAVMELGNASGFDFELEDRGHLGHEALIAARNQLLAMASQDKRLIAVRPNGLDDAPQVHFDIDREKANARAFPSRTSTPRCKAPSVRSMSTSSPARAAPSVSSCRAMCMTGCRSRIWANGISATRMARWHRSGFVHPRWGIGAQKLERYNGVESIEILGEPAPGVSSGQAMAIMEEYARKLPQGIAFEWTSVSFEQQQSAGQAGTLYLVSIIAVLLCLAALYESWTIPFSVVLAVPLGVLGAIAACLMRGQQNDIYFQVGLLTTVGLATKNAILIVEFARERYDQGATLVQAALQASRSACGLF
jgi:multidrug efflux pump